MWMLFAECHLNSSKSKNSEVLGSLDALLKGKEKYFQGLILS